MQQTTEASTLSSGLNVTRDPQVPQAYARDLAVAAVMCFIGGAGIALLLVLACYRAVGKKKLKERERQKEEEKEGSTVANHHPSDERRREALLQANSNPALDAWLQGRGGNKGQRAARPKLMTWDNRTNTEMEEEADKQRRTVRMVVEEERRIPNVYETDGDTGGYSIIVESRNTSKETFHCESCHTTYRAQQSIRGGRFKAGTRDSAPPAHRWNYNQSDAMKKTELGREARNVTFDLEGVATPTDKGREKRAPIPSRQQLKVKLNLNPLRRSKVHPRKKKEAEGAVERGSSKKSRDKRGRREKAGKGKSGDRRKSSRCSDGGASVKEDEVEAEGKGSETLPEQSGDADRPPDPGPDAQGDVGRCQGTLSAPERTQTTNLPLLGSAGSPLTGGGLSLQGGTLLLSAAPQFKPVSLSGPSGSAAPSTVTSGPSMGTSGALDSVRWQTGLNLKSPAASLLSSVHVNPLQAGSLQTTPLYNPPAGGLALNLAAADSKPIFQPQLLPDSVSLPPRLTSDPIEALGLQLGEELNKLLPESQAPQMMESVTVEAQAADSVLVVSSQAPSAQTEPGPGSGPGPGPGEAAPAADASASAVGGDGAVLLHQEYVTEDGDSSPRRKLKLALPEKTSSRPPTALERKIR